MLDLEQRYSAKVAELETSQRLCNTLRERITELEGRLEEELKITRLINEQLHRGRVNLQCCLMYALVQTLMETNLPCMTLMTARTSVNGASVLHH